jgi:hypothetical protein
MSPELHSDYQILINPDNEELLKYQESFIGFLYNTFNHISQQSDNQGFTFYLLQLKSQSVVAKFSGYLSDNQFVSPARAPFGGLEFDSNLNLEVLHWFWQQIEQFLQKHLVKTIQIKSYPAAYAPDNSAHISHLFLQNGFQIIQTDLNYHLNISLLGFENYLHPNEIRQLRKCKKANFSFELWQNPDLAFVHQFIETARTRKGYPMSLDFLAFQDLFARFPADFQVFRVKNQSEIIALTVTVRVNENILYNFYPADEAKYLNFSPLVLLHQGLYDYALANRYQILDLGIATENTEPNFGLIQFKRKLGCKVSLKLSFRKDLL